MLHILWLILKIACFLVLGLLILILLLALTVLFSPIRYQVKGSCRNSKESLEMDASFRWLFRLFCGEAHYRKGSLYWTIRILRKKIGNADSELNNTKTSKSVPPEPSGRTVDDEIRDEINETRETPESDGDEVEETHSDSAKRVVDDEINEINEISETPESDRDEVKEIHSDSAKRVVDDEIPNEINEISETPESDRKEGKSLISEGSVSEEQRETTNRTNRYTKWKERFEKLRARIKILTRKKDLLTAFLSNETHKQAFVRGIEELKRLLKRLKPKVCRADIDFGCDDPAHTGYVLAIFSMIYPLIEGNVELRPDFEKKRFNGEFYMKGNIRLIVFLIAGCNMIFDKQVRITFRHIRQLIKQL